MADVYLRSSHEVRAKAAEIRRMSARFQARMAQAADRSVQQTFVPVLAALVPTFMPSGYAPVLAPSLRASTRPVRSGVDVRVFAPHRKSGRDVRKLEQGILRHPDIRDQGKPRSEWRWHPQAVKPGMAHSALKTVEPVIRKAVDAEIEEVVRELAR